MTCTAWQAIDKVLFYVIPAKAGIQEISGVKENLRIPDQVRDDDERGLVNDLLSGRKRRRLQPLEQLERIETKEEKQTKKVGRPKRKEERRRKKIERPKN